MERMQQGEDLFEEAVNTAFVASLEQGSDGQGSNAAVLV